EVLQPITLMGKQMTLDKGLDWQVQLPEAPIPIWGDATRLQQVVLNLVSNAIKFTRQGYIRLQADMGTETVTVSLSDTGLGIPTAEQHLIFDEFRQSERTTARGYGGL